MVVQRQRYAPQDITTQRLAVGLWRSACHAQLERFVHKELVMRLILALQVTLILYYDFFVGVSQIKALRQHC